MFWMTELVKLAYQVVKLLVDKGFEVGTLIGDNEVSVAFYVGESLMKVKLHQSLTDKGPEWISQQVEQMIVRYN